MMRDNHRKTFGWCRCAAIAALLVVCVLVQPGLFGPDAWARDLPVTVQSQAGAPFPGVKVYGYTASGSYTGRYATTDAGGTAVFDTEDFDAGDHKFRVDYLGHQFWSAVAAIPETTRFEMVIETVPVVVTVTTAAGPAPGNRVYLYNDQGSYQGVNRVTGAQGDVYFELPTGMGYKFRADVLGSLYYSDVTVFTAGIQNTVAMATGGGRLTMTLLSPAPISGVKVYLFTAAGSYLGLNQTTDAAGQAAFDVSEGAYKVRADHLGYQFWSDGIAVSADTAGDLSIPHREITVTVTGEFDGHSPLEGLKTHLFTSSGAYQSQYRYTDAAGQAVFSLPDQAYKVRIDYRGRQFWSDPIQFQDMTVAIPMADARVTASGSGLPMADVSIYAFSASGAYLGLSETTDAAGQVVFRLPAGDYKFRADYQGSQYWSDVTPLTAGQVNPVDVSVGGGPFVLTVKKGPDTALEGAKCYVFSGGGTYIGMNAITDAAGTVSFDLAEGTYKIRVDHLGYPFWTPAHTVPDTLAETFTIAHRDITVTVTGEFNGHSPLEGLKTHLFTSSGAYQSRYRYTDAAGQAVFSLPDQAYKVRIDYRGQEFWSDPIQFQDMAVAIPMADARVTASGSGLPMAEVSIYAFSASGAYLGLRESTDAAGQVVFRLPAGDYKFRADYQGSQYWSAVTPLAAGQVNPVDVYVGGGPFVLTLEKGPGEALEGARCYVFSGGGTYIGMNAFTDAAGTVSFELAEGAYKIRVDHLGHQFWTPVYTVPDTLAETFAIPHARAEFTVHGDPDGAPLTGVKVYLFTAAGSYVGQHRVTDDTGLATFELPEKEYKIRVDYLGHQFWHEGIQVGGDTAIDVPVARKEVAVHVNGVYREPEPLENVKVYLFTVAGGYVGRNQVTDDTGRVAFFMPDRDYKVRVDYLGYQFWSDTIRYQDATVDIDRGIVRLAVTRDGAGLAGAKIYLFNEAGGYQGWIEATDAAGAAEFLLPDRPYKFRIDADGRQQWSPVVPVTAGETATVAVAWGAEMAAVFGAAPDSVWKGEAALLAWQTHNVTACAISPEIGAVDTQGTREVSPDETTTYTLTATGPAGTTTLSATVEVVLPRSIEIPAARRVGGDTYQLFVDAVSPYTVTGLYHNIPGDVTVSAAQGEASLAGSGSAGNFTIDIPAAGEWRVTVANTAGTAGASAHLAVIVDDAAPEITLDGPGQLTTSEDVLVVSGTATDGVSGLDTVFVTSDRYPAGEISAIVTPLGAFTAEVPLAVGENLLTVVARDRRGQERQASITVFVTVTALPRLAILTPEAGTVIPTDRTDVTGTVRSSLPPEEIRLVLGDQVIFPTGDNNEYGFTFEKVPLVPGVNTLSVRAETPHGTVSAQVAVTHSTETGPDQSTGPTLEIYAPLPDAFLAEDPVVRGIARSEQGVAAVMVNELPATLAGAGRPAVSFEKAVTFPATGEETLPLTVTATDGAGQSHTLTYTVHYDGTPPEIRLPDPAPSAPPAVNTVIETPHEISGEIVEKHLAGVTLNDAPVSVLPGAAPDTWTFTAALDLARDQDIPLTLTARDFAGHETSREWIARRDGGVAIEVITPRDGVELTSGTDSLELDVTVRLTGAAATDIVSLRLDGGDPVTPARTGATATATVTVDATVAHHQLAVSVTDTAGEDRARRRTGFTVAHTAGVPLAVQRQEPANGAAGAEPNGFIAVYFNKPMDPDKLEITVKETAHGLVYPTPEKGADLSTFNTVELAEVHRDLEPVPGGVSHFPGNTMAAFYADRDFAYGATVYVAVAHDGQELWRGSFTIRPLPTFVQGVVVDQFNEPLAGIEVTLPQLSRTAVTDKDGGYGFGFDDPAHAALAGGRYRALLNPGLKNRAVGTLERWIHVEAGRLNEAGISTLPVLNTREPFRRVASHTPDVQLAGGALRLDLSDAQVLFPDGRTQGDVHVQFMSLHELGYPAMSAAVPHWAYSLHPAGITVTGRIELAIDMPALHGSHDYTTGVGDYVLLLGLDPDTLGLVPVGAGLIDSNQHRVVSAGPVALQRLDYLGYALVAPAHQALVERFVGGEIDLGQLVGMLAAER